MQNNPSQTKTVMSLVLDALQLGAEMDGHIDQPFFADTLEQFKELTANIKRYDDQLVGSEHAPDGSNYNELIDLFNTPARVMLLTVDDTSGEPSIWTEVLPPQLAHQMLQQRKSQMGHPFGLTLQCESSAGAIEQAKQRLFKLASVRQELNERQFPKDPEMRAKVYATWESLDLVSPSPPKRPAPGRFFILTTHSQS